MTTDRFPWSRPALPPPARPAERALTAGGSATSAGLRLRPVELLGVVALALLSGFLNLFRLDQEGYANSYYAAAVRSMIESWHAFFFVSYDPGGFVTLDKPPLGFWLQAASAKLFGFHGWSLLLPQALAGVLSVVVLFLIVRRAFGGLSGWVAAVGLAVTPVAVAVNRNNTTDGPLVLALLLAVWALLRAVERGRLRWLVLAMALVGAGFNIKMLQAYLVLPALVLVYLIAAPHGWGTRLRHLAAASAVLVAVSFAWVAAVDLTPADQRPYVGTTRHNSALELVIGHNGLARVFGVSAFGLSPQAAMGQPRPAAQAGTPTPDGGGPGGVGENGAAGPLRLLNDRLAGQASWLLPLAVVGVIAALWQSGLRNRRDPRWQQAVLWLLWLLSTAAFFSFAGFFHRYYLVMLGPPVAALAGIAVATLWHAWRQRRSVGLLLPVALLATAAAQVALLQPFPDWRARLLPVVAVLAGGAALAFLAAFLLRGSRRAGPAGAAALVLGVAAVLTVPWVWSAATVTRTGGGMPAGGPAIAGGPGGPRPPLATPDGAPPAGPPPAPQGPGGSVDPALVDYLLAHRDGYRFIVATQSAGTASPIIIATGAPVMAMGGFAGSDPILTPESLARAAADGTVRFVLLRGGGPGALGAGGDLAAWVRANGVLVPPEAWGGVATAAGGQTLYQLPGTGGLP